MKKAKCCGAVIFRKKGSKMEFLVAKHKDSGGGHWEFPKGHMEEGETEEETAVREIYEEVGLKVRIVEGFRDTISYRDPIRNEDKIVVWFLAEWSSGDVKYVFDELDDHAWLKYDDAHAKLTFDNTKVVLAKARDFIAKNRI
jgi:8-oxo-dGTP pyrophosphatase MutT (NUDIX family)